jgi:universal stress protein E
VLKLKSLLFATELDSSATAQLETVADLAVKFDAHVHLLHVMERVWHFDVLSIEHPFYEKKEAESRERLSEARQRLETLNAQVGELMLEFGSVADLIVRGAEQVSADMILVGAGNHFSDQGPGHTAQTIVELAPQPVMVLHPSLSGKPIRSILCPIDHSDVSHRGLQNAIRLAQGIGAKLTVLSVVPDVGWLTAATETGELRNAREEYRLRWADELDQFMSKIDLSSIDHEIVLEQGEAHSQILAVAQKSAADLIVMGATGRSGLVRVLLGSTTRRVLRELPCSLIAIKQGVIDTGT